MSFRSDPGKAPDIMTTDDGDDAELVTQVEDENPESLAGEPVEFDPDDADDDDDFTTG